MKRCTNSIPALSAIVGIIIGVGVTAAAGSTLYYTFESQTDPFKSSSALDVRNLNAVKDDDLLRVTATLRNNGQTRIDEITIDKILVSSVELFQNSSTNVILKINGNNVVTTNYEYNTKGVTDTSTGKTVSIPYGQSEALIVEIKSKGGADRISNSVNVSDRLTITLLIKASGDTIITDAYSTRVKPG